MLAFAIVLLGVSSRLIFHAPNFNPVIALALFGGMYLKRKQALLVPVMLMVVSDLLIGLHSTIFFTWGSMLLVAGIGIWARRNKGLKTVAMTSLLSAFLFFVITNFGAWLAMYPLTGEGLRNCYLAALPFFRNTLVSTVIYSFVLFGLYEGLARWAQKTRFAAQLLNS